MPKSREINQLYTKIVCYLESARKNVLRSVNTEQVKTYWLIGQAIVEQEQKGAKRAEYDQKLLKQLSYRLTKEFGRGFGLTTLRCIRKFYLIYQIDMEKQKGRAVRDLFEDRNSASVLRKS